MYLSFYNLRKEPFHITPDPAFLFLSPGHKEALGAIIYGTEQRKGFVAVTGEVGTGKTTVVRSYLERIDRNRVRPIYIFNSNVSFKELLQFIFSELGIDPGSDNVYAMVHKLQQVLIEEFRQDHNVVLIIDEAQNMPVKTLENLRMLSNLETTEDKLIQIVLVGQPELEAKLNLPELRQLRQRIAFRAKIAPLNVRESFEYINSRLEKVRLSQEPLFTKTALRRIVDHAEGSPRIINILCDNSLIAGFGTQTKPITAGIVRAVISDYEGQTHTRGARLWRYAAAAVILLGCAGWAVSPYGQGWMEDLGLGAGETVAPAPPTPAPIEAPVPAPVMHANASPNRVTAGVVVPMEPAQSLTMPKQEPVVVPPTATPMPVPTATPTEVPAPAVVVVATPEPVAPVATPIAAVVAATHENPVAVGEAPAPSPPVAAREAEAPAAAGASMVQPPLIFATSGRGATRVVRQGDFLSRLCVDVYGFTNGRVLELVQDANPPLTDVDRILVGDVIHFPALRVVAPAVVEIGGK